MRYLIAICFTLFCCCSALFAQVPAGQIVGAASDAAGAAMPGVRVVVTNDATGQQYETITGAEGDYLVRALSPGRYRVAAERDGYSKFLRESVAVSSLQNVRVDLTLQVGAVTDTVTVTGSAPLIETRTATTGVLNDDKRITELPQNGRNVLGFVALTPGVVRVALENSIGGFSQQQININGNRSSSTNYQLDGASNFAPFRGGGLRLPPPDAVQEFRVVASGMTAEYGRGTAVISAVTKSGTNELHGTLYDYLRNDALDAKGFFDASKAKLRYNQFGGTIGGPVIKNKLFYFGAYQGLRVRQDSFANSAFPPTEAERRGDFSAFKNASGALIPIKDPVTGVVFANNQIPTNRFDPVAVKILDRIPLPNQANGRLSARIATPRNADFYIAKADYTLREADRFSFRIFVEHQSGVTAFPTIAAGTSDIPTYAPANETQPAKGFALTHTHTWSPRLITISRGSYSSFFYRQNSLVRDSLTDFGAQNFNDQSELKRPPQIVVNGRFNATPGTDQERRNPVFDFATDWSYLRGRHELKWGAQLQRLGFGRTDNVYTAARFIFDGTKTGNVLADFLLGRPVQLTQSSEQNEEGHSYIPAFYLQDNWRATSRLTLNLGLRWEVFTPWLDDFGQKASFIADAQSKTFPNAPAGLVYQTDPGYNYHTDAVNIGPRLGFAWDVFGDGKTAVRGGAGISFDQSPPDLHMFLANQPFAFQTDIFNPGTLSNPYAGITNPFPYTPDASKPFRLPTTITGHVANDFHPFYNYNLSLLVERQIRPDLSVSLGYVGNLGRKLWVFKQYNPARYIPGTNAAGQPLSTTANSDARRLFAPNYQSFSGLGSEGITSYHAMQLVVNKRLSRGLTVLGHYTWSKNMDNMDNLQTPSNLGNSKAVSNIDRRHVFVASYLYDLPFFKAAGTNPFLRQALGGWQLAGTNTVQSGAYFSIFSGRDNSLTAVGADRANLVGTPALGGDRSKADQINKWFETTAFAQNATGTLGTAGRNIVRGPGAIYWDMAVQKQFIISERQKLGLRAELFNAANHANLANPNGTLTSVSFGRITGTQGGPRNVQFALRYEF